MHVVLREAAQFVIAAQARQTPITWLQPRASNRAVGSNVRFKMANSTLALGRKTA
jgi:hypothetical protein